MRRFLLCCLGALASAGMLTLSAQTKAKAENVPEIPFKSVPDFIKLPPDLYFGEVMGVATNSRGHLFAFTRSGDTRLFEFDPTGKFVKEWGEGLYGFEFAHKVRVDSQDNVWAVDEGSNMVIKFNPQGRVVMVIGSRPPVVAGLVQTQGPQPPDVPYLLSRPTDVGWDPQGNIFVSDGYFNHRVVKYDKNGKFVKKVGSQTAGREVDQFNTPHTLAVDGQGNVYVGDRGNARVQVYDNNLVFKASYDTVGNPWEICISQGPHQYLFVSNSNPDNQGAASWAITGEIYKMELDGKILGRFGKPGKGLGEFQTVHGIDCRNPNELIVGELSAWRVQKLILGQAPRTPSSN